MISETLSGILEKHSNGHGGLIGILEEIQSIYSYLPREALEEVARQTNRPLSDVYGVATFYSAFTLEPRGRHLVSVCLGTACHVRGGPAVAEEIELQLGIKAGQTTEDREFSFETVNCLGACALGPVVVIDGHYFPKVTTSKVKGILKQASEGLDSVKVEGDQRIFPVEVSCPQCNHSLMDSEFILDGRPGIKLTVTFGNKHGWMVMSSLYGSYKVESLYELPEATVAKVFCPHCHAQLIGGAKCGDCSAPMVPMIVRSGGVIQICSRAGCHGHMLDLGGAAYE